MPTHARESRARVMKGAAYLSGRAGDMTLQLGRFSGGTLRNQTPSMRMAPHAKRRRHYHWLYPVAPIPPAVRPQNPVGGNLGRFKSDLRRSGASPPSLHPYSFDHPASAR